MNETLTRYERRQQKRELKEQEKRKNKQYPTVTRHSNSKSSLKTVEEEKLAMQDIVEENLKIYRHLLPGLLKKLTTIPDPRAPKKTKHKMTVMMFYGIMMFVFHMSSRRETNREMTTPKLLENLRVVFPELKDMPHQDTLCRLLEKIDVDQIELLYLSLLRGLIRKKTFARLLYQGRYLVAVDGTQKYTMKRCCDERYLKRKVRGKDDEYQYYAYVLEAVLILSNGMVLPLISEFLKNTSELERIGTFEKWKQDSELKAFYRLARRLKKEFPKLALTLLLDGLYANGPVISICRKNKWKFMIVLKDGSLPSVWQEAQGLMRLDTENECQHKHNWRKRRQLFKWANDIEYEYGFGRSRKVLTIHVVICEESWEETDQDGLLVRKTGRHAWVFSDSINARNVHRDCNLTARKRWLHENNILKEKHQGYRYEHIFSHNWNAMRGYHYLMHIARMLNEMALYSVYANDFVKEIGIQSFIKRFSEVMRYSDLDMTRLHQLLQSSRQLRLAHEDDWIKGQSVA